MKPVIETPPVLMQPQFAKERALWEAAFGAKDHSGLVGFLTSLADEQPDDAVGRFRAGRLREAAAALGSSDPNIRGQEEK